MYQLLVGRGLGRKTYTTVFSKPWNVTIEGKNPTQQKKAKKKKKTGFRGLVGLALGDLFHNNILTSAVSSTIFWVDTHLCKLRNKPVARLQ